MKNKTKWIELAQLLYNKTTQLKNEYMQHLWLDVDYSLVKEFVTSFMKTRYILQKYIQNVDVKPVEQYPNISITISETTTEHKARPRRNIHRINYAEM
mgnify:CR=1 FL=1